MKIIETSSNLNMMKTKIHILSKDNELINIVKGMNAFLDEDISQSREIFEGLKNYDGSIVNTNILIVDFKYLYSKQDVERIIENTSPCVSIIFYSSDLIDPEALKIIMKSNNSILVNSKARLQGDILVSAIIKGFQC
jgi:hypothetical protein